MSQERKLPDELSTVFVERLVQNLLEDADVVFHILNREAPITTITFLGAVIDVTLKRKPYVSAAGDILEKGKVKLAELQSVKSNVQDDKVGKGEKEQGEGEPAKELSSEAKAEISIYGIEAIKEEELEIKVGTWWNKNKDNWSWSGCITGDDWEDLQDDAKEELKKLFRRLDT